MARLRSSTEETVRQVINEQLNFAAHISELGPEESLWDMGMTSLTCMGLMLNIEDAFEIELPEALLQASTFRSVNSLVAAVDGARGRSGAPPTGEAVGTRD